MVVEYFYFAKTREISDVVGCNMVEMGGLGNYKS